MTYQSLRCALVNRALMRIGPKRRDGSAVKSWLYEGLGDTYALGGHMPIGHHRPTPGGLIFPRSGLRGGLRGGPLVTRWVRAEMAPPAGYHPGGVSSGGGFAPRGCRGLAAGRARSGGVVGDGLAGG